MATISNTLQLKDSMGAVLRNVISEMDRTIGTMERLDSTSSQLNLGQEMSNAAAQTSQFRSGLGPIDDELIRATKEQQNFNNKIRDGTTAANGLKATFGSIGAAIGIKKLADASDQTTQIKARLGLINDGLQSNQELQDKIYAAAGRSRGLYTDMAASVSKLGLLAGDAFENNDEIIKFTDTFQKAGVVGGSSASEMSNAMYQLNQAMASGRLQGDEFRSIIENAPMLGAAIEDYMINVKGATGSMKDWASAGLLTADVIKSAMFAVADDVDAKFEAMPMTWGQVWNGVVNKLLRGGDKLLVFVNLLANNWSVIEPLVVVATVALAAYIAALLVYNGVSAASAVATGIHTAFTIGWTTATFTATAAQYGLNAALLACPITWIILAIAALIALFYAAVAAVNHFAGTSYSATGIIMGIFAVAGAYIGNLFLSVFDLAMNIIVSAYNIVAAFANFFGNIFNDPVASIIYLFADMADTVLLLLEKIAGVIDTLFSTSLSDKVAGWRASVSDIADGLADKYGNGTYEDTMDKMATDYAFRFDYGDAWDKGTNFGNGLSDKFSGAENGFSLDDLTTALGDEDFDVNVKDDVNLADESLAYLLDAVTQKYVNKVNVTAPAPSVAIEFSGPINRDVDLDALAEATKTKIGTGLIEYAMASTDIKR